MRRIFTFLILTITSISFGQELGSIVGKLTDKDSNNEPVPFANVIIKGTNKGVNSDIDGLYALENVESGTYTIEFSFIGYETVEIPNVEVTANKVTTINVPMGLKAASLDEVFIQTTTRKDSEVATLLDQKRAATIKQSIGAEELSRKGVGDAAGAVSKISGVSRQEGGNNVYVRGLGDRYLNTTYNGLSIPSNNIEKKNIDLNLFASDVIKSVSVSKAYSTQFYGDFAAGNVNIQTKEHRGKSNLDIGVGSGINTASYNKDFVGSDGAGYFGFYNRYDNNPFSVVLSHGVDPVSIGSPINVVGNISGGTTFDLGKKSNISIFFTTSFENNFEFREGPAVDYTTVEKKRFPNSEEYEYSTATTAMMNLNYKVNRDHNIRFNSLFINSTSDEIGYYGTKGGGSNRDASLNTDKGFFQINEQFSQDLISVNQLIGIHNIDEMFSLNWAVGYNKVYARQPDRKRISVERYDLALDSDPNTNPSFFNNIPYDNQRYFQNIEDEELTGRINLSVATSETLKINLGYNGRTKERYFDNIRYGYDFIQPNTPAPNVNSLNNIFSVENLGVVYNTVVFNAIDPDGGIGNENLPGLNENTFKGNLDIYAGFVNAEINIGEKWLFVPGFRIESFEQKIKYDVINLLPTDPGFKKASENFYLPSLNIKYALNEDQNLRFSLSKTVSTPEFKEVAPYVYEDVTQRIGGNQDLLNDPSYSNIYNIDLKYEWFMSKDELFSIAAFTKQINDPINLVVASDATGTQRYFRTGDAANVLGGEIELRKNLLVNEKSETKLSVGVNATYMHSEQDLKDSQGTYTLSFNKSSDKLQGASPLLLNADINYSPVFGNYKPMATLVFSYFSDRIDAIGSGQLGNIIEKGVPTLDFIWKNVIGSNLEINAGAKNILNPNIERIRDNTSEGSIILSQYKRGVNLALQLKYKF